jgi:hypothetical protein
MCISSNHKEGVCVDQASKVALPASLAGMAMHKVSS